jgi:hypothetical protein
MRNTLATPWLGLLPLSRISRQSPQINTSLFHALYPHSCAPGNNFPIGHPSSNRSRPSTLNLEFFLDELPEKKVYLVDISILSILLSPEPGCHNEFLKFMCVLFYTIGLLMCKKASMNLAYLSLLNLAKTPTHSSSHVAILCRA